MRRKHNLLLCNGHPNAGLYTLGKLNDEAALVIERENNRMVSEAMLLQAAASSIMSKEGGDHFKAMIAEMRQDD